MARRRIASRTRNPEQQQQQQQHGALSPASPPAPAVVQSVASSSTTPPFSIDVSSPIESSAPSRRISFTSDSLIDNEHDDPLKPTIVVNTPKRIQFDSPPPTTTSTTRGDSATTPHITTISNHFENHHQQQQNKQPITTTPYQNHHHHHHHCRRRRRSSLLRWDPFKSPNTRGSTPFKLPSFDTALKERGKLFRIDDVDIMGGKHGQVLIAKYMSGDSLSTPHKSPAPPTPAASGVHQRLFVSPRPGAETPTTASSITAATPNTPAAAAVAAINDQVFINGKKFAVKRQPTALKKKRECNNNNEEDECRRKELLRDKAYRELKVLQQLWKISPRKCPNFVRLYGWFMSDADYDENNYELSSTTTTTITPLPKNSTTTPTTTPGRHQHQHYVLKQDLPQQPLQELSFILEYAGSDTLFALRNAKLSVHQFKSILFQILFALKTAQEECEFVHNDLHLKNIVLTKLTKDDDDDDDDSDGTRRRYHIVYQDQQQQQQQQQQDSGNNNNNSNSSSSYWGITAHDNYLVKITDFGLSRIRLTNNSNNNSDNNITVIYNVDQPYSQGFNAGTDIDNLVNHLGQIKIDWTTAAAAAANGNNNNNNNNNSGDATSIIRQEKAKLADLKRRMKRIGATPKALLRHAFFDSLRVTEAEYNEYIQRASSSSSSVRRKAGRRSLLHLHHQQQQQQQQQRRVSNGSGSYNSRLNLGGTPARAPPAVPGSSSAKKNTANNNNNNNNALFRPPMTPPKTPKTPKTPRGAVRSNTTTSNAIKPNNNNNNNTKKRPAVSSPFLSPPSHDTSRCNHNNDNENSPQRRRRQQQHDIVVRSPLSFVDTNVSNNNVTGSNGISSSIIISPRDKATMPSAQQQQVTRRNYTRVSKKRREQTALSPIR